jgi:hypothetical protein
MTNDAMIWATLRTHLPRRTWVSIEEIYGIVQQNVILDAEDLGYSRVLQPGSPRWKRNVRRLLRSKRREGTLMSRASS